MHGTGERRMMRGADPIVVSVVLLIAITAIATIAVSFWDAGRAPVNIKQSAPVTIDVQPVDVAAGTFLVENMDPTRSVTLSQIQTTSGTICDFGGSVTLGPDDQAVCTVPGPIGGDITFYGPQVSAATVIIELLPASCGNGVLEAGEECDDGNLVGGDCCDGTCAFEALGSACTGDAEWPSGECDGAGTCACEADETGTELSCSDGFDNDCDGNVDSADLDCTIGWMSNYSNMSVSGGAFFDGVSRGIDTTTDGGYIAIGNGYVGAATSGGNDLNMGAVKVDANGNIDWARIYGQNYNTDIPYAIIQDNDGNYAMVGSGVFALSTVDAVVVKLNPTGNIMWAMRYNDIYTWQSIIEDPTDGNYVVAGGGDLPGVVTPAMVVAKISKNTGAVVWAYQYWVTADSDIARAIRHNSDNSFIVTGDDDTVANMGIVMRIPNLGTPPVWTVTSNWPDQRNYDVMEDASGNFVVAIDLNSNTVGGGWGALLKLTSAGALAWAKYYEAREGAVGGNTRTYNVVEANTGEYILAGQVESLGGHLIEVETTGALGTWAYRYSDYADHPLGPRGTTNVQKVGSNGYVGAMDIEDRLTIFVTDTNGDVTDCTKYSDILADITWLDLSGTVNPEYPVPVDVSAMPVTDITTTYRDQAWTLAEDCVCQSGGC